MNRRSALISASLATFLIIAPLTQADGCGANNGPSTPATQAKQSCPANDNGYDWCSNNPNTKTTTNSQPTSGSSVSTPDMSSHRWGDYKFGDCGVSLYPATIGLTLTPGVIPTVDLRAGTACVGYPPKEFTLHIHIYHWQTPAGKHPYWHEIVTDPWPIVDHSLPPVAALGPDGEIPWALQHQITGRVACTPNNVKGQPTLYKLQIDMLGTSISGEPIVGGGETVPVIVTWNDCAGARK